MFEKPNFPSTISPNQRWWCHHRVFTFDFLWNLFFLFFLPAACAVFSATICWYFFLFFLEREKCFKPLQAGTHSEKPRLCPSAVTRILDLNRRHFECKPFHFTVMETFSPSSLQDISDPTHPRLTVWTRHQPAAPPPWFSSCSSWGLGNDKSPLGCPPQYQPGPGRAFNG